ncbi:MAG TPA: acid phosphatase, partial [Pseudolabrys sp.]|nr:acid phosphatase [Pseudolabrys sp.]
MLPALAAACLLAGAALAQPANIDDLKQQLLAYQKSGDYERGLAAVGARAQAYVEAHAAGATKPALVLDIDETSLSNWPRIAADDFGYIPSGACDRLPKGPCGAAAWERKGVAPVIAPTL